MQVTRTRLIAAAGLAGVLALAAAQASSAASAPTVSSPGKAAAGTPADAAAKRAAAARDHRGSAGSPADAAAKRAAAAREHGSGASPADVAAKRAAAAQAGHGSGNDNLLLRPDATSSIARSLGVSEAAVTGALRTLVPLSEASGGLDPAGRGFVAAAAQLGVPPAQLAGAIAALKMAG